jgi:hypothetical protein
MNAKQVVSQHLGDYASGVEGLLNALVNVKGHDVEDIIEKLICKDSLLQEAVAQLSEHRQREQQIEAVRAEIRELDEQVIGFTCKLGDMEQDLHDAVTDLTTLTTLDGDITQQRFAVRDMTILAEKLGQRSFAPADYIEKKGLSTHHRPPQPIETEMAASRLHLDLDELLAVSQANAAMEAELGGVQPMADGDSAPIVAAENGLPTFAEMRGDEQVAKGEEWGVGSQPLARQTVQRNKVGLGLSLALGGDSDDEEVSDDFSDDGDDF